MNVRTLTTVRSAVEIVSQPYFLGGEHRQVLVNGECRLSIIPQPSAIGVHNNLFEIAKVRGENLEIIEAFCTEGRLALIIGEMILNGNL